MSNMLKNEHGRYLQSHELFPKLGFKPGHPLPDKGFEPREVEGVMFKCDPAEFRTYSDGRRYQKMRMRVRFLCECGVWVPFGRASQHKHA